MLMLLRRMGQEHYTVHGFRSTFRDWATDFALAPRELAEQALAHSIGTGVERAYARSDGKDRRATLMSSWDTYLTGGRTSAA